jgi:acyl-coenzyme A synthetase/AMP-(fatty) acid ligase
VQEENFAFSTLRAALSRPDTVALEGTSSITYQRFADLVVHFARRMQEFGVDRHSAVGLSTQSPVVAQIAVTAVGLLGAHWLHWGPQERANPLLGVTHAFSSVGQGGSYEFTRTWFEAPAADDSSLDAFPGHGSGDDVWMIASSSGTTGRTKYMRLGYRAAWRRISGNVDLVDGRPMILASLFSAASHTGLRPRLGNLLAGGTNVNAGSFARLQARGVNRVMGSPIQIATLTRKLAPPAVRIRSCRLTGSVVTLQFVERALQFFDEVQVLYGSTETGGVSVARFSDERPFDGSVGYPLEGAMYSVVDEQGRPVEPGTEGILRLSTDGMVAGYVGNADLTRMLFTDSWFEPGDLGYVDEAGALHVSGRRGDVINIGGVKFNATDIDEVLLLCPDVVDGYCFVAQDDLGADVLAAVVSLRQGARDVAAVHEFAVGRLGRNKCPRRLYVVDTVPRNENGKPMRAESARVAQSLTPILLR